MSEKRVKAWAVVSKGNEIQALTDRCYLICVTESAANAMKGQDERVVPVEIVWKEEK